MKNKGMKIGGVGGSGGSAWDEDNKGGIHMGHVVYYGVFFGIPISFLVILILAVVGACE